MYYTSNTPNPEQPFSLSTITSASMKLPHGLLAKGNHVRARVSSLAVSMARLRHQLATIGPRSRHEVRREPLIYSGHSNRALRSISRTTHSEIPRMPFRRTLSLRKDREGRRCLTQQLRNSLSMGVMASRPDGSVSISDISN